MTDSPASTASERQGTRDSEIDFEGDPDTVHYAILEPADNAYGWRISYVSIGHA